MRRTATTNLEALDPEVLAAARDMARRAGVPVESWIASVIPSEGRRGGAEKGPARRRGNATLKEIKPKAEAPVLAPPPAKSIAAAAVQTKAPVAARMPAATPSAASPAAEVKGTPIDSIIDALVQRLDSIDRVIAEERETAQGEASRRIESLEARISTVLESRSTPVPQVVDRLGEIERRMSELGEQFAASRPLGRRGRAAMEEVRDAVEEIRQRRRELEGDTAAVQVQGQNTPAQDIPAQAESAQPTPSVPDPVAAIRLDLARRLDAAIEEDSKSLSSVTIIELGEEIGRLRDCVGSLASGQDVTTLEQMMQALAGNVARARQPADLAPVLAPVEAIRAQVEQLAGDVSDNVHTRVLGDFERIAGRIDAAMTHGVHNALDSEAVSGLVRELEEIRHVTAALAGPERIQGLVEAVQALGGQIEDLRNSFNAADAGVSEIRPLLEEIRSGIDAQRPQALTEQFETIATKLDAIQHSADDRDTAEASVIVDRIEALSEKVDRVGSEGLRQPAVSTGEFASIQAMLQSLADKVDTVGRRTGGAEGLDVLEKHVLDIVGRLDARAADPTMAGLQRTMTDLLGEVSALRDESAAASAVERAARNAVAGSSSETGELSLLRAGLAEFQVRQIASEDRMHATLDGVRSSIDRLVIRMGEPRVETARTSVEAPSLEDRLLSSTGIQPPRSRAAQDPEATRVPATLADAGRMNDELLEPGALRPLRNRILAPTSPEPEPADGSGDIKTSFIAAARRAAQAAHAEVAQEAAEAATRTEKPRSVRKALLSDQPELAAPQRSPGLRGTIEKRRKPLLLGLAAVVLILGALQAITMSSDPEPAARAPLVEAQPASPAPAPAEAARAPLADPQTTQSIGARETPKPGIASTVAVAPAPAPMAAKSAVPQVSNMQSLGNDLAGLPSGLSGLKQAALDGDGAAVYELAVREADGRGMPRDLAVAAKLYEKLASAGYAPAQYRLGGQYEKGSGVTRDLGAAKLWYTRAAEQGHARSMHNLAVIYAENPGPSGKPDFATAGSWFRKAAEYGVRDSQYNLAVLYARGLGVSQDLVQSFVWFSAAATQGDTEAAKKRDDVAGKLSPEDLAKAKTMTENFKPLKTDPAVNEPPLAKDAAPAAMTLLGAPVPGAAKP